MGEKAVYLPNNAQYMATWKLIRTKEYEALQSEVKGFYEVTTERENNVYLNALARMLQGGMNLPDVGSI